MSLLASEPSNFLQRTPKRMRALSAGAVCLFDAVVQFSGDPDGNRSKGGLGKLMRKKSEPAGDEEERRRACRRNYKYLIEKKTKRTEKSNYLSSKQQFMVRSRKAKCGNRKRCQNRLCGKEHFIARSVT